MLTGVVATAIILWAASATAYIVDLASEQRRTASLARLLATLALPATLATGVLIAVDGGFDRLARVDSVLVLLSTLLGAALVAGQLPARGREPITALGALVAPAIAVLLAVFLLIQHRAGAAPQDVSAILLIHIALATLGLGNFALASALSALYLTQERQLRTRRFGALFHRLPSLEVLDLVTFRLTIAGFAIFTLALVMGVYWAVQTGHTELTLRIWLSAGAWLVFAAVLHTRITSGWRGRQAAWLTIAGTAAACATLAIYLVA